MQVIPGGSRNKESTPGYVRGFDVRTGKLMWTFHTVPQKGEPGYETWENDAADYIGNVGIWSMLSADPETGYVYLPTETPSNDFYGGHRLGDGLYAESIVCLDAKTGKKVWHFQTVHHGVWDYDNPAAPIVHDIIKDGKKRRKVVTLLTKQSLVFVFDAQDRRADLADRGAPGPALDKSPASSCRRRSPSRPSPAPLAKLGYHEDDLIDFTPELRAEAIEDDGEIRQGRALRAADRREGRPRQARHAGSIRAMAAARTGMAAPFDPETHIMYVPDPPQAERGGPDEGRSGAHQQRLCPVGQPCRAWARAACRCSSRPTASSSRVDMNRGEQLWRVPLGPASPFVAATIRRCRASISTSRRWATWTSSPARC